MASQALIKEFEDLLGKENVFSSEADRQSYSYDSAVLPPVVPAFALRPTTTEQLGICVKKLYDYGIPMTVRGAGTNLSGGTIPDSKESVVILTNGLNRILEINSDDLYAVVEPGVVTATFAAEVAKKNLFYPPDPGSQAVSTLAGNIAENAGGLRGLKYGVTKDYLMGLEFFDATGELVKSGSRTVKCVTGYNLAGMMLQSEGTLGIISQAVLKLVPPPQASKALMAVFDDMQKAAEAVAGIIAAHVNNQAFFLICQPGKVKGNRRNIQTGIGIERFLQMNAVLFKQFRKICCPKIRVDNIQIDHCHLFPFRSLPQCQINRKIGFSRTIMSGNQCDSFHGMTPLFRSASVLTYNDIITPFLKKCNCLIPEIAQKCTEL